MMNCGGRLLPCRKEPAHAIVAAQRLLVDCVVALQHLAPGRRQGFAGASGIFVNVFLEVRTLFETFVHGVATFLRNGTGLSALPTPIRHVLVFPYAISSILRCSGFGG